MKAGDQVIVEVTFGAEAKGGPLVTGGDQVSFVEELETIGAGVSGAATSLGSAQILIHKLGYWSIIKDSTYTQEL